MYPWGDDRPFNSYSGYFRKQFGGRVQKLAVNAGFTCPNRDGRCGVGGCTFCNNEAFTPSYCQPRKSVTQQIAEGIEFHTNRYRKAERYLVYFQSFSNTYAPMATLERVYGEALSHQAVAGIVIGTRPDCVNDTVLDYFARLAQKHYVAIEYGMESCYDDTLKSINRGHDFECACRAAKATAERGIHVGAHFILGLPGESEEMMIRQTDVINSLPLTTVKFHQLQIFKGTAMAVDWQAYPEKYRFWRLSEYMEFFTEILRRLRPDLVVERFAGESPPQYHLGPNWGLVRNEQLLAMLEKHLADRHAYQGELYAPSGSRENGIGPADAL